MPGTGSEAPQDIASGIYVTIMLSPTVTAGPRPRSKACDALALHLPVMQDRFSREI